MTIKVEDLSCSPHLVAGSSTATRLMGVNYNTGNLLFQEALRRLLPSAEPVHLWDQFESDCDMAVLSMANFISPTCDVARPAEALRVSPARRIVLVGCGAQAQEYDDWFELRPDTRAFLQIVSDRSRSIGVRGQYSAELLRRHGFANTRVIGCPAFYRSGSETPAIRPVATARRIAVGATPSGDLRDQTRALFSFGQRWDAWYVVQSETFLSGLFDADFDLTTAKDFRFFSHYYRPNTEEVDDYAAWLRRRCIMFFDVAAWIDYFRNIDLYVGTRIHGAVAAIQAGCPALVLVHDTRTRELCQHFNMPFIELRDFDPDTQPDDYLRLARFDQFRETYPCRLAEYCAFLEENDIDVSRLGSVPGRPAPQVTAEQATEMDGRSIGDATHLRLSAQARSNADRSDATL